MNKSISKWMRSALGVFLIAYALNQFLHIIPTGYGKMPMAAQEFLDSIVYFLPYLYWFEILVGLLLVMDLWPSIILILLTPLTVAFLIFNVMNGDLSEMWPALIVALLNAYLVFDRKEKYLPLLD